jgi:hypothetical protein
VLLKNIFLEEAGQHGKEYVFIKENQVYEFMPYLAWHFPGARYVYQVRDPRDMALSWKKSAPHVGGVIQAARQWKIDQQQSLKNFNELKKREEAVFVRYEDLITGTEAELARILDFMGLDYEPGMLQFHQDRLTKNNAGRIKAWENLSVGVLADNKMKYLDELTQQEIRYIEKICMYEMLHLGYETEFQVADLEKIPEVELEEFKAYERETISVERSEGIRANMEAKRKMYTKISKHGAQMPGILSQTMTMAG